MTEYLGAGTELRLCAGGCGKIVRRLPSEVVRSDDSVCSPKCRGIVNGNKLRKMTMEQVREAYRQWKQEKRGHKELANDFGVSVTTIGKYFRKHREILKVM